MADDGEIFDATTTGPPRAKILLGSVASARRALAKVIRAYWTRVIQVDEFRAMVYGLSALISGFKTESDLAIEKRIEALEKVLLAKGVK